MSRFFWVGEMQTAPEIPRPLRQPNSFPAKVTFLLSRQSGRKSSYFKEGRALPYEPSTAPERHPPLKEEWTWRDSNPHLYLGKELCCRYTTGPRSELTSVVTRIRASPSHLFKRSFVSERTAAPPGLYHLRPAVK